MKILVFDIFGNYAHYKKIYATTSAVSYPIPTKTSLYGYTWAIACTEKSENKDNYLKYFNNKQCLLGIGVREPIRMQRINTNLRAKLGRMSPSDNRKPTTMEYVYKPKYRIFFWHSDTMFYEKLKNNLSLHVSEYTPTLGLAGLLSNFVYIGEFEAVKNTSGKPVIVDSIIPKTKFKGFDNDSLFDVENEIIEQSMYPVEMDLERNVTERDDILFDRKAKPISAYLTDFYEIKDLYNVVLF